MGELINGIVKRVERGDLVIDLGTTEGVVPRREQVRGEHYNPGDRIRAIIVDVERSGKGPQVVVSRTDPRLVMKLFEMEVPEIYDGTVRIVSTARDAGERTKIGVQSRDRDVDPVGACVGMKGSRVQSVIRELRGEKIDIVQYHEDMMTFVREALKPASANRVASRDDERREVEVIVADEQLSLAIGKRGQNVRLAGRLVGWRIDVKSETEKRAEVDAEQDARDRARTLFGRLELDEPVVDAMIDAGFRDLAQLLNADLEDLTLVPGIDVEVALDIHDKAEQLVEVVAKEEEEAVRLQAQLLAEAGPSASSLDDEAAAATAVLLGSPAPTPAAAEDAGESQLVEQGPESDDEEGDAEKTASNPDDEDETSA